MILLVGCYHAPTHILKVERSIQFDSTLSKNNFSQVKPQAVDLLKTAKRIAIKPPSHCVDESARADQQGRGGRRDLVEQCGVIMSSIERELFKLGFDVISWQKLKAKGIEASKVVDLVLEINELSTKSYDGSDGIRVKAEFATRTEDGVEPIQLLSDSPAVMRCSSIVNSLKKTNLVSLPTATINTKLVRPSDGSVIWFFQHTIVISPPKDQLKTKFVQRYKNSYVDGGMTGVGTLITGGAIGSVGAILLASDGKNIVDSDSPETIVSFVLGLALTMTGVGLTAASLPSMDLNEQVSSSDRVLCNPRFRKLKKYKYRKKAPSVVTNLTSESSSTIDKGNKNETTRREVRQKAVDIMIKTLADIKNGFHK